MRSNKLIFVLLICLIVYSCASTQNKKTAEKENPAQEEFDKAVISLNYNLFDEAIRYLNNAIALDAANPQYYYTLGVAYFQKKDYPQAEQAFEQCLTLQPDHVMALNSLGVVYQEMKLFDKAEEQYKKAFSIDGNFDSACNLSRLYLEQDKLEPALNYVRTAIQKNNNSSEAFNIQGVILNKVGRFPEAIQSLLQALKINPQFMVAGINLGVAYINNKEYSKARELFEKMLPYVQDQALKDRIHEYLELIKDRNS
jgi:tetratricopeptide (TPR) repeat protein